MMNKIDHGMTYTYKRGSGLKMILEGRTILVEETINETATKMMPNTEIIRLILLNINCIVLLLRLFQSVIAVKVYKVQQHSKRY